MAGLASAGAAAGTAIMPGIGTAVGGVVGALADTFMGGGAGSASAMPQNATTAVYGSGLDGSNWNVNFSGMQTATSSADKSGSMGASGSAATPGAAFSFGQVPVIVWVALAAVVVWKSKFKK